MPANTSELEQREIISPLIAAEGGKYLVFQTLLLRFDFI